VLGWEDVDSIYPSQNKEERKGLCGKVNKPLAFTKSGKFLEQPNNNYIRSRT